MASLTCSTNLAVARRARRRRGVSIAESLMASTVLAIAVVGIAGPIGAAGEQSDMVRERGTAIVLARQLLEEIAAKPLCDGGTTCHLGPESGETTRAKFDSADDYHQYHDTTSDLYNLSGQRVGYAAGAVYTRDVTVEYRATIGGAGTTSGDFGLIKVVVTTPHNQTITIHRLLCKEAQTN